MQTDGSISFHCILLTFFCSGSFTHAVISTNSISVISGFLSLIHSTKCIINVTFMGLPLPEMFHTFHRTGI